MMLQMEPHQKLSSSPSSSTSTPSFSTYSSETLAQIAARVIQELTTTDDDDDHHHHHHWEQAQLNDSTKRNENDDDDFEFAVVSGDNISSPVSADEIFSNGLIKPTYPLFDRNLLSDVVCAPEKETVESRPVRRLPLRKLMLEEEGGETGSCSSSTSEEEAQERRDELSGVAEGSYCVWVPPEKNKDKKKKSSSMRSSSSKRWKLRELLRRSHSDGKKKQLMFVGPTKDTPAPPRVA
ncbi:hypothetical protein RIF29_06936 [Crotalaria pallida]|uniref:Uncharacterized protein n=1 Tax=Crotalaria pallida TaxID=3830 RepID=A0AAN9PBK1_CROPI